MRDNDFHLISAIGTLLTLASMVVVGVKSEDCSARAEKKVDDPFANMVVIDAALAELATRPDKQPQKKFKQPEVVKPVGVSTDDQAKPLDKPPEDEPKDKPDPAIDLDDFKRPDQDEEAPTGKQTPIEKGEIGGSPVGFGDKTYGDPYLGALKSTFLRGWEYPEILDDVGVPVGCIRLNADGTIEDTKLMQPSGNGDLDSSVEQALAELKKKVNQDPKAVPDNLTDLTRIPLCWRMKV